MEWPKEGEIAVTALGYRWWWVRLPDGRKRVYLR
jgi:hypothetical protein